MAVIAAKCPKVSIIFLDEKKRIALPWIFIRFIERGLVMRVQCYVTVLLLYN
jgi:hypothetical protein